MAVKFNNYKLEYVQIFKTDEKWQKLTRYINNGLAQ